MSRTTTTGSTDLFRQLSNLNNELWRAWLEGPPRMLQSSSALGETYQGQIKGFRRAVEETLRLEHQWVDEIRDHSPNEGLSGEMSRASAALMEAGINTRSRFWQVWFDNAERLEPRRLAESMQTPQQLFTAWQQFIDGLFEAQRQAGQELGDAAKSAQESITSATAEAAAEATGKQQREAPSKPGSKGAAASSS
ncbi:MAG TPA: hypothetical protein VFL97_06155 [Nitrococcus sp.]|nr:hypothetical protein [Nitrococcus sp.]